MLFLSIGPQKPFDLPIAGIIAKIKNGEPHLKEELIANYKPFIIKTVSRILGNKYLETENSEEFSVALMAFAEAIDCFDESKQRNFLNFAKQVIKRRIINYWESNRKNLREYPFSYFENENIDNPDFLETIPAQTPGFINNYEIKEEIQLFKDRLAGFGVTLGDLVSCSPKHRDSKLLAIKIARIIAANDGLFGQMTKRKALPANELLKTVDVNQRTLERHRKFIIAISLILRSDLEILKDYIHQVERRGG